MEPKIILPWNVSLQKAKALQLQLQKEVCIKPLKKAIRTIAGVDVAFDAAKERCFAAAVVFSFPALEILEELFVIERISFPYIPGFLTFREGPAISKALSRLTIRPDLIMFDGQGIAHPKGLGIASHMGVLFSIPTIGCAKSRLYGMYEPVGNQRGSFSYLESKEEKRIGVVLRTRDRVKPLFVSPGHLVDILGARDVVLASATKYRLPEPTRIADRLSKKAKKLLE